MYLLINNIPNTALGDSGERKSEPEGCERHSETRTWWTSWPYALFFVRSQVSGSARRERGCDAIVAHIVCTTSLNAPINKFISLL